MSRRLSALHVGNFKAFADTQRIPLKPITLVFGPNSAGKSSFIHSLALAHEAQFGREKRGRARLDVHHTEIGGSAIDLGGYRQFVHRGQLRNGVEWGAELKVSELGDAPRYRQLKQLLSTVETIALNITLGVVLDDEDRPVKGAPPHIRTMEILADGVELLRMSRRPGEDASDKYAAEFAQALKRDGNQVVRNLSSAGISPNELASIAKEEIKRREGDLEERAFQTMRIDRLDSDHAVLRQVIQTIVETQTFALGARDQEIQEALGELLSRLEVRVDNFLPSGVVIPDSEAKAANDVAEALGFWLPRTLNDLIKGLSDVFAWELKQLQYLGPLRSFPARHLAFAEQEDSNWYAGGGYAWDVVRNDEKVRKAVNAWLGKDMLKTPYELRIKELVNYQQVEDIQVEAQDSWEFSDESDPESDTRSYEEIVRDDYTTYESVLVDNALGEDRIEVINELVLMDVRKNTIVTHRDVGIGISQVLPVLVMAYASRNKLLAMEQPEIHLHPALQAELADVFVESTLGERKNTFILETHSEHLILRLLRRVREGRLSPNDLSVLYVQPTESGSTVLEVRVDEDGDFIDRWPGGFFEEAFDEREAGR
ncbi:DUF3696 domain-containing protein [Solilutibacter silvestris]|uniref:AAA domain-containing protein n=1 Tax=Solilutibacter silvestris TaxID=1645665 RepID=A0A2K1Q436_9GAMM|nr:DUF3696 domain-containing protein [Lysobacter silvestris]PNS09773.1 hypothetical protein Lysil_1402 [Lysobacter silvestris]